MQETRVGIIGGTGLGETLAKEAGGETVVMDTPFGPPSGPIVLTNQEGVDVALLSRHGEGHLLNPSNVPYRANIWALKKLGVTAILASGATGSLREDIEPGHLVLCDQVIDKTHRRPSTFFDEGLVVHVEFAEPFCPRLRGLLAHAGTRISSTVHHAGTYVCMEGPQFSTRAESHMHRQWGGDLVGMTCLPEAKLAREAEICYALIAFATDYDCWRPPPSGQDQQNLLPIILNNLHRATQNATLLIRASLRLFREKDPTIECRCREALKLAIWSDRSRIDPRALKRFELLTGRYLTDGTVM